MTQGGDNSPGNGANGLVVEGDVGIVQPSGCLQMLLCLEGCPLVLIQGDPGIQQGILLIQGVNSGGYTVQIPVKGSQGINFPIDG